MTTTTAILAAITTVTVSLDADAYSSCDAPRYAEELAKVFPGAEVEVKRAGIESSMDARGEIDGAEVRIVEKRGRVDVLGDVDAPSDADEDIRARLARAWEHQFA